MPAGRFLYIVVCGAPPAPHVAMLIGQAQARGWNVQVIATPAALDFIDCDLLWRQTGLPVRSSYRNQATPAMPLPRADAIIVAPATYNTINKWAAGISDTYALGVLAEAPGSGVPIVVLPFLNMALARRAPFRRSVEMLREEGVEVLDGPGGAAPHQSGNGGALAAMFPWHLALTQVERRLEGGTAMWSPA